MKRIAILILLTGLIVTPQARVHKRWKIAKPSLVEIGPKASLYIGNDVQFGFGAELVFNPIKNFGLRLDFTEIRFGSVVFNFNYGASLDGIIYIPMRGVSPYIHTGFGFKVISNQGNAPNSFEIRAGMGVNYPLRRRTNLFVEPGIIISGDGDTKATFRLSGGARFGLLP